MDTQTLVPVELIDPNPYQPRGTEDPEAVAEIAASIARNGLMQVPTARQANGHYQLAFGHTRLAAFKLLQEQTMPLIVRELDDLQMFELGVSENIKRRDLNPIEQAQAMKRYMEEFGKSSVEAAEFFGLSEEAVRGKVRLLNLPVSAQEKLAEGAINVNTARALLSMQKIAPEAVVVETIKKIEKNPGAMPEDVIGNAIGRMDEVVHMWSEGNREGNREGKPRSRFQNGWLLDMKNFPNKLLPQLTPVDIAIALGIQDDQELIEHANAWYQIQTGEIDPNIDAPAEDGWELTPEMMRLTPELVQKLEHLITPPVCSSCPFYTRMRGNHYCGMKTCHTRKTIAWHAEALQKASKNLKIDIYKKSDGAYKVLDYEHQSLFKNRNKGLRLLPKDLFRGYAHQYGYQGVDTDIFVVVATGDAMDKMGTASSRGGKKSEKEKAKMRMMKIYRLRRKDLLWEFTGIAKSIFEAVPVAAIKRISAWKYVGVDDQIRDEWKPKGATEEAKAAHEKRMLVWTLISDVCSDYHRRSMSSILKDLQGKADDWGVKIPKSLVNQVAEWDAEIASVAAETPKKKGKG